MKKRSKAHYHSNKNKICANQRAWRKANPDKFKNIQLKYRFGITLKEHNDMLTAQKNKCAICNKTFRKKAKICIDHSHVTGKIRGLLCQNCNVALGMVDDKIATLKNMISYLKEN